MFMKNTWYNYPRWEPEIELAAKLYPDFGLIENGGKDGDGIVAVRKPQQTKQNHIKEKTI